MSSTPKMRLSPSASRASTPPRSSPFTAASISNSGLWATRSTRLLTARCSQPHIRLAHEVLLGELVGPALDPDPSDLQQIGAIGELQDLADVLLDDEDRVALLAHAPDEIEEPQDHDGGQPH